MRDFNIVLDCHGKACRKRIDRRNIVKEFTHWIKDIDMVSILSRGFEYTWSNNRDGDQSVYTKIDHMFCNDHWKTQNPHFQLDYEAPISSNHSPGILATQKKPQVRS